MTEPAKSRSWSTIELRLAALIVLLAAALWAPRLRGPLDLRYDAGVYYILGRSLAEGHGYRLLNEPGAIEAIQYPPVLPAVAALHQLVLGTSDPVVVGHALRLTMALLFLGYAFSSFALARRYLSPGFAFAVALLAILNVQVLFLSDYFSADLPYAAVSLFFFVAPVGFAAGALAVLAFGLRTAGVALLAAWAAQSLLHRRWREAAVRLFVAVAAVGGWQVYVHHVKAGAEFASPAYPYQRAAYQFYNVGYVENMSYVDPFRPELGLAGKRDLAQRLGTNLQAIPTAVGEAATLERGWLIGEVKRVRERFPALAPPDWTIPATLGLLSAMVIGGLVLLARRGQWLPVIYVVGSIALIVVTPWPGQFRPLPGTSGSDPCARDGLGAGQPSPRTLAAPALAGWRAAVFRRPGDDRLRAGAGGIHGLQSVHQASPTRGDDRRERQGPSLPAFLLRPDMAAARRRARLAGRGRSRIRDHRHHDAPPGLSPHRNACGHATLRDRLDPGGGAVGQVPVTLSGGGPAQLSGRGATVCRTGASRRGRRVAD